MTLVIPDQFINVHFGYLADGDNEVAYTALGAKVDPGLDPGQKITLATSLVEEWQVNLKEVTAVQWLMTGSYVEVGDVEPPYVRADIDLQQRGVGATLSAPNNCAALIKKTTGTAGRQGRGRMYVPGLAANAQGVNGVLDSTERENWQDGINAFLAAAIAIDGIVAGALFHDSESPADQPGFLVALTVDAKIATQRRRMRP